MEKMTLKISVFKESGLHQGRGKKRSMDASHVGSQNQERSQDRPPTFRRVENPVFIPTRSVVPNLESRLQQAWLHIQLSSKGPQAAEVSNENFKDNATVKTPTSLTPQTSTPVEGGLALSNIPLVSGVNESLGNLWKCLHDDGRTVETTFADADVGSSGTPVAHEQSRKFVEDDEDFLGGLLDEVDDEETCENYLNEDFFTGLGTMIEAHKEMEWLLAPPIMSDNTLQTETSRNLEKPDMSVTSGKNSNLGDGGISRNESEGNDSLLRLENHFSWRQMMEDASRGVNASQFESCRADAQKAVQDMEGARPNGTAATSQETPTGDLAVDHNCSAPRSTADLDFLAELMEAAPAEDDHLDGQVQLGPMELLLKVADLVVSGNMPAANKVLNELHKVASLHGDASQRIAAYFLEGLSARLAGDCSQTLKGSNNFSPIDYTSPDCSRHLMQAFQVLMHSSPYLTFGQVVANCAILEACIGEASVHIVDFGIGHGLHWPPLLHALAARPQGPPRVRMTAIDLPSYGIHRAYCVLETGQRLKAVAAHCGLEFEYSGLASKLESVRSQQIEVRDGELLIVNCALRLGQLLDETVTPSNPRSKVLATIRQLAPSLCTVVEPCTGQNAPFFLARFYEALYYYSSVFEALDASVPSYVQERHTYEQQVLGKAIVNVVACEGRERFQRSEPPVLLHARMRRARFAPRPLSQNITTVAHALLQSCGMGYDVQKPTEGSIVLVWKDTPLLSMTAWQPDDAQ